MDAREVQRIAERCQRTERAATELGLHEIALVLREAGHALEDVTATWYFGQYQQARSAAEQSQMGQERDHRHARAVVDQQDHRHARA